MIEPHAKRPPSTTSEPNPSTRANLRAIFQEAPAPRSFMPIRAGGWHRSGFAALFEGTQRIRRNTG